MFEKQSQFPDVQMNVSSIITRYYESEEDRAFAENKPKQSQMPAFRRELEALSPKS
jgi:hypothetical protein